MKEKRRLNWQKTMNSRFVKSGLYMSKKIVMANNPFFVGYVMKKNYFCIL